MLSGVLKELFDLFVGEYVYDVCGRVLFELVGWVCGVFSHPPKLPKMPKLHLLLQVSINLHPNKLHNLHKTLKLNNPRLNQLHNQLHHRQQFKHHTKSIKK